MKSIKEKAEAYDKVLEWATEAHKVCDGMLKEDLEHLFPELKESEDERIRKALLEMVHDTTGDELWVDYNVHKEEALAWLEKQGEQKSIVEMKSPEESLGIDSDTYNKIVDECIYGDDEQKPSDTEKGAKGNEREIPNSAWSEADEKLLELSVDNLTELKNRFGKEYGRTGDCIDWLKSLRDRYTWKPSDEQMEILRYLYETSSHPNEKVIPTLESLYQDLKKLKGA